MAELQVSNIIRFKTSMKCASCVATVMPDLNTLKKVNSWKADVIGVEKTLSINAEEAAVPKSYNCAGKGRV